jgi:hypothetical protein
MSWSDTLGGTCYQLRSLNKCIPDTARSLGALRKSVKDSGPSIIHAAKALEAYDELIAPA